MLECTCNAMLKNTGICVIASVVGWLQRWLLWFVCVLSEDRCQCSTRGGHREAVHDSSEFLSGVLHTSIMCFIARLAALNAGSLMVFRFFVGSAVVPG